MPTPNIVRVQVLFFRETEFGVLNDALYFSQDEFKAIDDASIESMINERVALYEETVKNLPPPTEPTLEDLQQLKLELETIKAQVEFSIAEVADKISDF